MQKTTHDPKRGAQKVTNTDEQEVAVNHSTSQEGGFDEPVNQQEEETKSVEQNPPSKEAPTPERSRSGRPRPADDRKKKYHEEETE